MPRAVASLVVVLVAAFVVQHGTARSNFTATLVAPAVPTPSRTLPVRKATATASATVTVSRTGPLLGGVLAWQGHVGDPTYTPAVSESYLIAGSNWSAVIEMYHDEFDVDFLKGNPELAFRALIVRAPYATMSQPRSVLGRMDHGRVITPGSLQFLSAKLVRLTLLPDDFLQLRDDEVIAVSFTGNATVSHKKTANAVELRVTGEIIPRDETLVSVLGAVTAVGAVLTVALGMPGLHLLQSAAMIGSSSCTDKHVQAFTFGAEYFLSPLPLHNSAAGRLMTNVLIAGYLAALHAISCRIISGRVARMTLREAMSRTYFPSVPYGVCVCLYPGFVYFAVLFAYQVIDGGLTVIIYSGAALAAVLLGAMVHVLFTARSFMDRRFALNESLPARNVFARFWQPLGYWGPPEVLRMYRAVLWPLAAHSDKFMLIIFAESGVTAAVTAYQPGARSECRAQFGLVALWTVFCTVVYLSKAPYRYFADNALSAMTNVALLVMTVSAAVADGDSEQLTKAYRAALILVIVLGAARCAITVWRTVKERKAQDAVTPRAARKVRLPDVLPMHDSIPEVVSDGESSGDDDAPSKASPRRAPAPRPAAAPKWPLPAPRRRDGRHL
jgi:hypothetical protein